MRVVDRLAKREDSWRELEFLVGHFERGRIRLQAERPHGNIVWVDRDEPEFARRWREHRTSTFQELVRLADLYRAACADLMLAESHDLPRETVAYLHALVARAHNVVYRSRGLRLKRWAGTLFSEVPRRLRSDPTLKIAALAFWGTFILFGLLGMSRPRFAEQVVGPAAIDQMEAMYSAPFSGGGRRDDAAMAGFYIFHNARIGLSCYAWGLILGVGSLFVLLTQGIHLGAIFGHMGTSMNAVRFFTFVTAHAPFELTAIVFSGAAGLRLGMGLVITDGQTRLASLRREARASLPIAGAATFLFILAAFLEGFVSASALPYAAKAAIALVSAILLVLYLALGGRGYKVVDDQ
jgi:uncharacterized membrane protein SpoIIM required for sporulation